uniref:Uncharacterized protein n=1 Tax=Brassica oleracea var. oleracea TaxID=109376 RepID=A0A0D3APL4_BRAOL
VAPKKKRRIVGIGSINEVARTTSSYTSRRDEETAQMKPRVDSQQVRLDSLEDLLDMMAVGNPVMQRILSERRAALGMPPRDPQESDPTLINVERFTRVLHRKVYVFFTTKIFTSALHRKSYVEFTTKSYVSFTTKPCSALYEELFSS